VDILDRVLDKGIVVDAWVRLSAGGIALAAVEARIVVASIETYLRHDTCLDRVASTRWPAERRKASRSLVTGAASPP
jgi:hypothetical protein